MSTLTNDLKLSLEDTHDLPVTTESITSESIQACFAAREIIEALPKIDRETCQALIAALSGLNDRADVWTAPRMPDSYIC